MSEAIRFADLIAYEIGGGWGEEAATDASPDGAFVVRGTDIPRALVGDVSTVPYRFHKTSNLRSRALRPLDIVFEVSGGSKGQPVGRALLVSQRLLDKLGAPTMCASFCKLIRLDPQTCDPRFVFRRLQHEYATGGLDSFQVQSTGITNFRWKPFLDQFEVVLPPRSVQERVADVLEAIDDLIENNRRRVELLEEMARAIYREWFVHFRYPGHEDIPLVDSPLGPIPDGWRLGVLRDLATEIRRSVKPSAATAELPYLPIDAIDPQSITVWGHRPGTEAKSSLRLFDKGDVVFGAMRAYFHKVCVAPFDGVTRSTCFVLRADPEHYWYAALTLAETSTVAYAAAHSSGSTIPYAKWEGVLSEMPVILPPASVSEAFAERVQPLLGMAQNLADQAQPLASLRDRLLPKLVTGRIDVSHLDLEHLAEAVSA